MERDQIRTEQNHDVTNLRSYERTDFFAKRDFSGGIAYSAEQGSVVKNQVWSANLNFRF